MLRQFIRGSCLAVVMVALAAVGLLAFHLNANSGLAGTAGGPFAYVANGAGQVSVIDLSTETESTTIATGGDPYWVAISSDGTTVAASLHNSTGVALIDGTTNLLLGVVGGVGSEPEAVAVNSTGSTVYVADESGENLYVVDVSSETVTAGPIDLSATCGEPENMVISPDDAFLYITCADFSNSNAIRVATAGFAITTVASGLNDPHGIALNAAGTRLYYTDGTDVFEWNTGTQADTGTTFSGCNMYFGAVSPDGTQLYCQEEFGDLIIYDTSDGSLLATINTGGDAVAAGPDGTRAYVPVSGVVEVIDTVGLVDLPGDITMTGSGARGIAVGPPPSTPTPTPTATDTPTPTPTSTPQLTPPTSTPTLTPTSTATPTPTGTPQPGPTATFVAASLPLTGAGSGGSSGGLAWLIVALIGAPLATTAGYAALRVRKSRM